MVKLIEVSEDELQEVRKKHRGRLSYPLLKLFMESGLYLARLESTGLSRTSQSLLMSLRTYVKNHQMPIRVRQHRGEVYLQRIDIDEKGNPVKGPEQKERKRMIDIDPIQRIKEMSK